MLSDWCDGLMSGFRDLQDPESPEDSESRGYREGFASSSNDREQANLYNRTTSAVQPTFPSQGWQRYFRARRGLRGGRRD